MTTIRKSTLFIGYIGLGFCTFLLMWFGYPLIAADRYHRETTEKLHLIRSLHLNDLCLFTEARYTRHLSQADIHSAFQDQPMSMEHFPSGSIVRPPQHLWSTGR